MGNQKQSRTAQYALIQGMYWMSFCVIFTYASVYLLDKGLSNTSIGLLIAVSGTVSAVLQPLIGGLADGSGRCSLKSVILLIGSLMALVGICLTLVTGSRGLTVLCYGVEVVLLQVLTPLIYSLGMGCINRGERLNFGLARGIGSLAFAAVSYGAGFLVASVGTVIIPAAVTIIYGVLLVFVYFFGGKPERTGKMVPPEGAPREATLRESVNCREKTSFFSQYPRFIVLLAGAVLVFVSHNLINNFAFQIMESKGGGSSAMGTAIALAAASELPTMFLFGWMVKRVGCDKWLKISGLFFLLKALATVLVTDVTGMYLIQGLQMFGFALFAVASVYYVNSAIGEKDRIKGQAYMTMTNTLGSVLGSLLGGVLIDGFGILVMLLVSTVAAAAGMVLMGVSARR